MVMDIIRSSTTLIILAALANTAASPAIAGEPVVIEDTSGRTIVTIREYPSGNQLLVQDRAGRTLYVIRRDPYGGHSIQDHAGRTVGLVDSRSGSSRSFLDRLFGDEQAIEK